MSIMSILRKKLFIPASDDLTSIVALHALSAYWTSPPHFFLHQSTKENVVSINHMVGLDAAIASMPLTLTCETD
ncbi:hypothetical protein FRX31_021831 [Thalictrum thalictroides]|uniref:Uncharacterized protein n=1 Tax=Thalictrum thalictroides TaxID=46969 RepID=A0A7J6VV42_THATH|nr:hypothetical protein FRX31_021831 [Thalictrum thalictroides]